jgi:hypothetical protein
MTFLRHRGDGENSAFPSEQDKYWNEEKRLHSFQKKLLLIIATSITSVILHKGRIKPLCFVTLVESASIHYHKISLHYFQGITILFSLQSNYNIKCIYNMDSHLSLHIT